MAKGDAESNSNVDVVMEVKDIDTFVLLDIEENLSELLGCEVDLVRLRKNLNRVLQERIEKEVVYV